MFRYVLARASEHPSLAAGQTPPELLSPREEAVLAGLVLPPRRRKWLMGRWAAKRLLLEVLASSDGAALFLRSRPDREREPREGSRRIFARELSVLNDDRGVPHAELEGVGRLALSLSLSHRGELGLAAVTLLPATVIGADLETLDPRDPALVRQFFTAAEAASVAASACPDLATARVWSGKEAVLKALGTGLRVDTRCVEVGVECDGPAPPGWRPLAVTLAGDAAARGGGRLTLLWREEAGCVLTVALLAGP
jgi:phosphopantetheinyl transferase (holo-ACP synthase)